MEITPTAAGDKPIADEVLDEIEVSYMILL